ncbi:hypothetical protein [Methylobacterium segetis]|uniref:hypothetical protein n=1 Tax=Methylobacterium segetis TaxID=2488750 RepID=UPI00104FC98F|nr:hypothetical protein [Methylobacterium segetis]
MSIRSAIARLFAAFAVIGLLAGAFAAPSMARAVVDMSAYAPGPATEQTAAAMPDDMPCCDPEASDPDCRDTKACPFAALCAAKLPVGFIAVAPATGVSARAEQMPMRQDRLRPSLGIAPQGLPPRPLS